jgi:hypothetical protein
VIERTTTPADQVPDPRARAILDALVRAKGLERYAYFFVTGEGRFLPDGTEESSGCVLDASGRVFSFWTGWDAGRGQKILAEWEEVSVEPHWRRSAEYRRARAAVGLEGEAPNGDQ